VDYPGENLALALHVADYLQTRQIVTDRRYYESNPILGENPTLKSVNQYFAYSAVFTYIAGETLKPEYRKYFYSALTMTLAQNVANNSRIGISFKF